MDISLRSWVVLYSFSQDKYQIETIEEMVQKNQSAKAEGRAVDFIVLNIVENRDEADALYRQYRPGEGA